MNKSAFSPPFLLNLRDFLYRQSHLFPRAGTGAVVGLISLILIFSLFSPTFHSLDNILFLAQTAAITISLVSLGQTIVMISGGIDFSVSSVIALTGLISALLFRYGFGPIPPLTGNLCYIGILIAWIIGLLIGAGQGWLITRYQIPPFIVTLATFLGLRGITIGISGQIIYGLPTEFRWMSEGHLWIIPIPFVLILILYAATDYMLHHSKVGRYCYAIGGNETAARLAGINVNQYRIFFYAFSGLLAAMTGTLLVAHLNAAIYSTGEGYEFSSVASAIIGGTSLAGGMGGVWGTLVGVAILTIIPSGLIMLSASPWFRDVITALIIILAVIIDVNRMRRQKKEIQVEVGAGAPASLYLNDILNNLARNIEKYTGIQYYRMYLADRDTGELVAHTMRDQENEGDAILPPGKSLIANEAYQTSRAVILQDTNHNGYQRIKPIEPGVQSALAVPILYQDACIGVIELQSPGVGVLKESTIDIVRDLVHPVALALEDAWLLESGWLVRQLRDALRHLWDDLYLGRLALADWALASSESHKKPTAGARGKALRELLIQSIDSIKPQDDQNTAHGTRSYRILQLTYVEELAVDLIINTLHISRRQYFYELKNSIEILIDQMVRNHHA